MFFLIFFQAEDGIRDATVTGVQTCALPISLPASISSRTEWKTTVANAGESGPIFAPAARSETAFGLSASTFEREETNHGTDDLACHCSSECKSASGLGDWKVTSQSVRSSLRSSCGTSLFGSAVSSPKKSSSRIV